MTEANKPYTKLSWMKERELMLQEWGHCEHGDLMLEYVAQNVVNCRPETWLRRFVFVVSKFLQGLAWPVGLRSGVNLAAVDEASETARRGMRWARGEAPSSRAWNEIETEVLKALSFGKFREAMNAAKPPTGRDHLFAMVHALRSLARQIDRQEHARDMLNKMAGLVRAICPDPPERQETK